MHAPHRATDRFCSAIRLAKPGVIKPLCAISLPLKNIMDKALELLIKSDNGILITDEDILNSLENSSLVKRVTDLKATDPLSMVWSIIALSEIPFSNRLDYTGSLKDSILKKMGTSAGFTLTGKKEDFLPCYNAMIIKAFSRMGFYANEIVENGINWILRYQSFERNFISDWNMPAIHRHGGCLKKTPCFIGLAKSVYALVEFNKLKQNEIISAKIDNGLDYILEHNVYQRLSNGKPITKHILDLCFPESYNVSILELLLLLYETNKLNDKRVEKSISIIKEKINKNRKWGVDYVYSGEGYISFDGKSKNSDWISYKLNRILKRATAHN